MRKGSLSVFFAMILSFVMCLILTMAECIRLYELHDFSSEFTNMAVESAFSEFNPYLWTNYKILAVDLGYGTDLTGPSIMEQKLVEYCEYNANVESGHNYARLNPVGARVKNYALLTDANGLALQKMGARAAMDGMAAQVIDAIQGKSDSINNIEKKPVEKQVTDSRNSLNAAKEELAAKKRAAAEDDNPDTSPDDFPTPEEVEDDPFDAFDMIKESFSKGVLSTVTDVDKISEAEVKAEALPSHRALNTGNLNMSEDGSIVDKALFIDYLMTNYEYFGNSLKHDGLKYEVEYLVGDKETDSQNLAAVVEQILLIREAANFLTITKSDKMMAEARAVATVLTSFNPALKELVTLGIVAAWAYVEAMLDLRLILSGGKVSAVKSSEEWTSDVWHLSRVGDISFKARECKTGLNYKEYLIGLLAVRSNSVLSMRALDILENALQSTEDYKDVKVDNMLWAANIDMSFTGQEMFLGFFGNNGQVNGEYYFEKSKYLSY